MANPIAARRTTQFRGITRFMLVALALLAAPAVRPAAAAQADLTWTAPTTPVAGYKVHIGSGSRNYQQHIDVGNRTSYLTSSLADGSTYYFTVSAYNGSGVESSYSNEVTRTFAAGAATYTITATAGGGGRITALNNTRVSTATSSGTTISSVTVTSGANQSFSIVPSTGYRITDVKIDGASKGAITSWTFTGVQAPHSISATFALPVGAVAFATNCGGPQFTDSVGVVWRSDAYYSGGTAGTTAASISGTVDDPLFTSRRIGSFAYNIPIANGDYAVTLRFAETYYSAAGQRVFDVKMEGAEVLSNLDIFARAGKNTAYNVTIPVTVTDGQLNIGIVSNTGSGMVQAIRVKTR